MESVRCVVDAVEVGLSDDEVHAASVSTAITSRKIERSEVFMSLHRVIVARNIMRCHTCHTRNM